MQARLLALFPWLTISLFLLPLIAALAISVLTALGYWPALGGEHLSLQVFIDFFAQPGVYSSIQESVLVGVSSSLFALLFLFLFLTAFYGKKIWRFINAFQLTSLALPHLFFALALFFLFAPSGWLLRIPAQLLSWQIPPAEGVFTGRVALIIALVAKETLFLLFIATAALARMEVDRFILQARSLGYGRWKIWFSLIWPQLYPTLRLSFYVVVVYSFSVVELPLILGPEQPAPLAVVLHGWIMQGRAETFFLAAAGSLFLAVLVAVALFCFFLFEKILAFLTLFLLCCGKRKFWGERWLPFVSLVLMAFFFLYFLGTIALLLFSCSRRWRFPDILPTSYTTMLWQSVLPEAMELLTTTFLLAALATLISLVLVLGCLEYERVRMQAGKGSERGLWLLYLPFLLPQLQFLFGLQLVAIWLDLDGSFVALLLGHILFVLPYLFITLGPRYRQFDHRYSDLGQLLGHPWLRVFIKIKLPLLARPIAFSCATGFVVSVVQYLPTLYLGGGRFMRVTTEAVAGASGGDMRVSAVYGLLQAFLPLLCYGALFLFFRGVDDA